MWSTLSEVTHQLESRMRENRLSGSEGGGTTRSPYPYIRRLSRSHLIMLRLTPNTELRTLNSEHFTLRLFAVY